MTVLMTVPTESEPAITLENVQAVEALRGALVIRTGKMRSVHGPRLTMRVNGPDWPLGSRGNGPESPFDAPFLLLHAHGHGFRHDPPVSGELSGLRTQG